MVIFLIFLGTSILFSLVAEPVYIPTKVSHIYIPTRVPFPLHFWTILVISHLFDDNPSNKSEVIISLWFRFALPWWLVMLSILPSVWPFVYLLWKNVCSIPLPIFKSDFFVFLLLNGRNSLYILQINLLSDICSQSLSHVWLCHPMDCNPPGSSVHGIFLVRILEWVAISSSRGTFWPRDRTHNSEDSYLADGVFTTESIYRMGEIFGDHIRPVVLKYFPHSVKWLFILMCRNFLVCCSSACWFCIFFFLHKDGFDHCISSRKNGRHNMG